MDENTRSLLWRSFIPCGMRLTTAGHLVGEDELLPDSELLQDVEVDLQVACGVVGLADLSIAVGDGDHIQHVGTRENLEIIVWGYRQFTDWVDK